MGGFSTAVPQPFTGLTATPPNIDPYANLRALAMQGQIAQQKQTLASGQQQMQLVDQQIKDQQAIAQSLRERPDGESTEDFVKRAVDNGASGNAALGLVQHFADLKLKNAQGTEAELKSTQTRHDQFAGQAQAIVSAKPENKQALYAQYAPQMRRELDPGETLPDQYPGDEWMSGQINGHRLLSDINKETLEKAQAGEATAKGTQATAEANKAEAELPGIRAKGQIEQRQAEAMKNLNPQTLKSWVDAAVPPTGATAALNQRTHALAATAIASGEPLDKVTALIKDASDQIGRTETALRTEQAKAPTELAIAAENRRQQQLFQSYTQNNGEIDKLAAPVQQTEKSIGDIRTLIAEGSPQAWANIPAKLLSLTVGGQGSGLRMNNAILDRELGGAGKWAQLQGMLQQWSLNPATASRIPEQQRQQITSIVNAMASHIQDKTGVINNAREALITAPDIETHRRTVLNANQQLQNIDNKAGQAATTGTIRYTVSGKTYNIPPNLEAEFLKDHPGATK